MKGLVPNVLDLNFLFLLKIPNFIHFSQDHSKIGIIVNVRDYLNGLDHLLYSINFNYQSLNHWRKVLVLNASNYVASLNFSLDIQYSDDIFLFYFLIKLISRLLDYLNVIYLSISIVINFLNHLYRYIHSLRLIFEGEYIWNKCYRLFSYVLISIKLIQQIKTFYILIPSDNNIQLQYFIAIYFVYLNF